MLPRRSAELRKVVGTSPDVRFPCVRFCHCAAGSHIVRARAIAFDSRKCGAAGETDKSEANVNNNTGVFYQNELRAFTRIKSERNFYVTLNSRITRFIERAVYTPENAVR